jgi:hypothetical protein
LGFDASPHFVKLPSSIKSSNRGVLNRSVCHGCKCCPRLAPRRLITDTRPVKRPSRVSQRRKAGIVASVRTVAVEPVNPASGLAVASGCRVLPTLAALGIGYRERVRQMRTLFFGRLSRRCGGVGGKSQTPVSRAGEVFRERSIFRELVRLRNSRTRPANVHDGD